MGSRLQKLLEALGVETVANDPPLADRGVENLVPQAEALACDIISLHVPLSREGRYPTAGMIGPGQLARMPAGGLLVNAARGDVVDGAALLDAVGEGRVHAALDVWPEEPQLNPELLKRTVVATPHVAGYSNDGKRNGTFMVYDAFCQWSGEDRCSRGQDPGRQSMVVDNPGRALEQVLEATCFVERHDRAMRELVGLEPDRIALAFDRLRKDYPYRRDFHAWDLQCDDPATATLLGKLGFEVNKT